MGIRKEDQDSITGRINNFFTEVNKDLEVKAALTRLGFQVFMDELYYTNVTFEELKGERICSISKRHTKESKTIQRECQAVLRHLFEQIELAQNIYKDKDYTLLIDALNTILAKYTKGIKRRATYNKKRAEAAAKELALSEPTTHILSVNGKETGTVTLGRMKKEEMKTTKRKRGTKSKKNLIFETQKTNVDVKNKKPILKAEEERKKINIAEGLSSATSRVSRV